MRLNRAGDRGDHRSGRGPPVPTGTYGLYRLEIIATIANGLLLLGLSAYIPFAEAIHRWSDPEPTAGIMIAAAPVRSGRQRSALAMLRRGSGESLAAKGAYLRSSRPTPSGRWASSWPAWSYWSPGSTAPMPSSVATALFMIPRTLLLLREASGVLMENAPRELDLDGMREDMLAVRRHRPARHARVDHHERPAGHVVPRRCRTTRSPAAAAHRCWTTSRDCSTTSTDSPTPPL